MRLHVAFGAWIRIVAPGATHLGALFQDREATLALPQQLDRHAEAAEPCADDGDFEHFGADGRGLR
jgi:hypothetical protein